MVIMRMSAAAAAYPGRRPQAAVFVLLALLSVLFLPVGGNSVGPESASEEPPECNACLHVKSEQAAQVGDAFILDSDLGNEYESTGNWTINANASTLSLYPFSATIVVVRYEIAFPSDCCTATTANWELRGRTGFMEPWISLHNVTNHRIAPGSRHSFPLCTAPLQPFNDYSLRVEVADNGGGVIKISDVKLIHQYCNVSDASDVTITGIVPHRLERAGEVMIYGDSLSPDFSMVSGTSPSVSSAQLLNTDHTYAKVYLAPFGGSDAAFPLPEVTSLDLSSSQNAADPLELKDAVRLGPPSIIDKVEPNEVANGDRVTVSGSALLGASSQLAAITLHLTTLDTSDDTLSTPYAMTPIQVNSTLLKFAVAGDPPPETYDLALVRADGTTLKCRACISVTAPAPTIAAIEPPLGIPGGTITIRGTGLQAGLAYVDDDVKLNVSFSNDTTVVAVLPEDSPTKVMVTAHNTLGQSVSTTYELLTIQELRPSMPQAGHPLDLVVSNLAAEPSVVAVVVGGFNAPISSVNDTLVTVNLPLTRFNNTLATVVFSDGRNTSTTFTDPNALFHAVTPSVGVPGMIITITGNFFLKFLESPADVELAGTRVTKVGTTQQNRIAVRAGAYEGSDPPSGFVSIRLDPKDPDLYTFRSLPFKYASPSITGISSRVTWANHEFSIYGSDLVTEEDSSIAYTVNLIYNSDLELAITYMSPTEMRLRTPQQARAYSEGSAIILLWSGATVATLVEGPLVVHPPSITHLSSFNVSPGQLLTLFTSDVPLDLGVDVTVMVADEPAEIVALHSQNITVVVPLSVTGSDGGSAIVDLQIDGVSTNTPSEVSLGQAPRILQVSPSTVTQGVRVTLTGEGFDEAGIDPSTLRLGGQAVEVTSNSSSTIVFAMPPRPSNSEFGVRQTLTVSIQAHALHGTPTITFPFEVTYTLAGVITTVVPSSWKRGDRITIKGHRFSPTGKELPFTASPRLRATVGQQQLRVVEVSNGDIIAEALADGRVGGAKNDATFALELGNGFMVFIARDTCRCPTRRIGGVTWPGVVGCDELSRTQCQGRGVDSGAYAYRRCTTVNRLSLAVNTSACANRRLRDLSVVDVREDNVDDVLQELTNFTRNTPLFAPEDVRSSYHIIRNATKLLGFAKLKQETFRLIFKSASDLLAVDGNVLEETARQADFPVSSIPEIVEQWTDGVVDLLSDDEASIQAEENVIIAAYRFGAARSSFEGVANAVNRKCELCPIAEAGNTSGPLLIGSAPVNYSIASSDVEAMAITLFRDSRLFAGGKVANPLQNTSDTAALSDNTTFVDSPVLSIQTRRADGFAFEGEVRFSLPTKFYETNGTTDSRSCSFWRVPTAPGDSARWSDLGCSLVADTNGVITCSCNHLTNFAVLANYGGDSTTSASVHNEALSFITYIGVGISIFCLLVTLCIFLYYERLREDIGRIIVMHLSANLIVTLLVFAFGIEATGDADTCTAIAIVLHYFLLSAFCWMLVEGYHLYVTFVTVFRQSSNSENRQHLRYAFFAYGIPAIIVLITGLIIGEDGYGYEDACWLPTEDYEIWAFLGPMCLVIVINLGLFIAILRSILSVGVMDKDKAARQRLMRGLRASASFLTIMGVTWVFGALLFSGSIALQYLFTIFNVLQGVFIFVFHCWWNGSVRDAITGKSRRETVAYMRTKSSKFVRTGTSTASQSKQSLLRQNSALSGNLRSLSGPRQVNSLTVSEPRSSSTNQYLDLDPETMGGIAEDDEEGEEEETVMGQTPLQVGSLKPDDSMALESVGPLAHVGAVDGDDGHSEGDGVNSSSTEALGP